MAVAAPSACGGAKIGVLPANRTFLSVRTQEYTLAGRAERITCPTWVCSAEGDEISESAPQVVAALTCDKEYVRFTAAEGAGDHCEAGARTLHHARSFAWLDAILRPRQVSRSNAEGGIRTDAGP